MKCSGHSYFTRAINRNEEKGRERKNERVNDGELCELCGKEEAEGRGGGRVEGGGGVGRWVGGCVKDNEKRLHKTGGSKEGDVTRQVPASVCYAIPVFMYISLCVCKTIAVGQTPVTIVF